MHRGVRLATGTLATASAAAACQTRCDSVHDEPRPLSKASRMQNKWLAKVAEPRGATKPYESFHHWAAALTHTFARGPLSRASLRPSLLGKHDPYSLLQRESDDR
eukprot:5761382-Prymnesium_polylepis.2